MKNTLKALVTLAAFATAFVAGSSAKVAEIGQAAPDFSLTDITGKSHKLSDFKGKTVVLEWVNPECPFVVKHYNKTSNIPKLQKTATSDGVVWLSINSGSKGAQGDFDPSKVMGWMKETGAAPSAYFRDQDGTVGKLYDAKTTPQIYVIDPAGTLAYKGGIDSIASTKVEDIAKAEPYVINALAAVKAGQPVPKAVTKEYGCSVKY